MSIMPYLKKYHYSRNKDNETVAFYRYCYQCYLWFCYRLMHLVYSQPLGLDWRDHPLECHITPPSLQKERGTVGKQTNQ